MRILIAIGCIMIFAAILSHGVVQSKCHDTDTMKVIKQTEFLETTTILYVKDIDTYLVMPTRPVPTSENRNIRVEITDADLIRFMSKLPKTHLECE